MMSGRLMTPRKTASKWVRKLTEAMASVSHALWDRQDASLMILPASIPLDNAKVRSELTTYLDQGWESVLDRDVDGPHAISRRMDSGSIRLSRPK